MSVKTKRERFNRNIIASSRGNYVRISHIEYIKSLHNKNIDIIKELSASIKIKPRYFVKCFGHLHQITEREAMMLGDLVIIM